MSASCAICGGTGFEIRADASGVTRALRCSCDDLDRGRRLLRSARIPKRYDHCTFETFEIQDPSLERAKNIAAGHGLTLRETGTGGASDGNFTADLGTPTLDGIGPVGSGAHTPTEYLILNSLASSATLIASLLLEWPED